jgi:DNA-binding response OmpR family regulator
MTQEKILIIDDEADLVESIARNLEADGFQTIRAFSGADGLRKATDEHPDLILLDVAMRDLNGYEVLTKIKDRGIPTRVIVFTGYATSLRDVVKFIKAGACDYVIKGHGATVLVMDAVKRALAVETTINLHVSDTTPIVEQLIASAEKLSKDKDLLQMQNTALVKNENRASILMVAIRLLCLLIAVGLTALLSSFPLQV